MKKLIFTIIISIQISGLFLSTSLYGQSTRTKDDVQRITKSFLLKEQDKSTIINTKSELKAAALQNISELNFGEMKSIKDKDENILAYVQELRPKGFVIISANTNIKPILGFSFDDNLSSDGATNNPLLDLIISDVQERQHMTSVKTENNIKSEASTQWGPWLQTTWRQGGHWNNKVPYKVHNEPPERRVVGCVATAMAQIINYWQYPNMVEFSEDDYIKISNDKYYLDENDGWGFPSLEEMQTNLSTLQYNGDEDEEANLSFAAGVKLHMNFNSKTNDEGNLSYSSGANTYSVGNVLNKQFGFGSAVAYSDYAGVWYQHSSEIIEDMKNGWPAQIAFHKSGKSGGHSIVIDGWREDGFFHLNYGWGANSPDPISTAWYDIPTDMPVYDIVHTVIYHIAKYKGWSEFGADQRNSFHSIYPSPINEPERKWHVNIPDELTNYSFSRLIIGAGGRIYASISPSSLGSDSHPYIAIYDKYGTLEKLIEVTHSNVAIPYLNQNSRGEIFFSSGTGGPSQSDSRIYLLNPNTEEITPIFSHNSPDAGIVEESMKIDRNDNLYFFVQPRYVANYTKFYSVTKNGTNRWSYSFPSSAVFYNTMPAIDEDRNRVYLNYFLKTEGSEGVSHLIAFDINDGTVIFDKELATHEFYTSKIATSPAIGLDGTIYVDADNILFALQSSNGDIDWQRTFRWRGGSNPIPSIGTNGELYVTYDDKVSSLDIESNGATIWEKPYTLGGTEYLGEIYSSSNGMVVISYEKDGVYRMGAIKDNGLTYEDSWDIEGGGTFAFGPGRTLVSIPPGHKNSIWVLSDLGERGDPEGLGMDYVDNNSPSIPSISFPENGSTDLDTIVNLSWSCDDIDGHNLKYDIYICPVAENEESAFSLLASQITANSYNLTGLLSETQYLWMVVANDGQAVNEGEVWSFTTKKDDTNPIKATNPSPINEASNQSIEVELSWSNGGGATSYKVYFGTDSTPDETEYKDSISSAEYSLSTLNYNTTYYWRIDAVNSGGTTSGDIWHFTTEAEGLPNLKPFTPPGWDYPIVPSSVTGTNTVSDLLVDEITYIDWACINDGNHDIDEKFYYKLYLDDNLLHSWYSNSLKSGSSASVSDYNVVVETSGLHVLKLIVDPDNDIPESDDSDNEWSKEFYWGSSKATLPNPADEAINQPIDLTLSWTKGIGTSIQQIHIGTDPMNLPRVNTEVTESFKPWQDLQYGTQYYWRIDGMDYTTSITGDLWSFTTKPDPSADSLVLVKLYNECGGLNWTNKTNWLTGELLSNWDGIVVENGRVTRINLNHNNLTGKIPSIIGNLYKLKYLNLGGNQLSDTIPSELGQLADLEKLDLASNNLTGTIPTNLSQLVNLEWIYLCENQLSGNIPKELGELNNVVDILFNNNQFTGSIPKELGDLDNLWRLSLGYNQLVGSIPSELGKLGNLSHLSLSSNNLSGPIPSELGNLTNLNSISLAKNQLEGSFPQALCELSKLENINLSGNQLNGSIPSEIGLLNLFSLFIDDNLFSGLLPSSLGELNELSWLYVNSNKFSYSDLANSGIVHGDATVGMFHYSPQDKLSAPEKSQATSTPWTYTLSMPEDHENNVYHWFRDGNEISGANERQYTIPDFWESDVNFYCKITNPLYPDLTLESESITISNTVGIEDQELNQELRIYPNPTQNNLTIELQDIPKGQYRFEIYNIYGEILKAFEVEISSEIYRKEINCSGYAPGNYILKIISSDGSFTKMFGVI